MKVITLACGNATKGQGFNCLLQGTCRSKSQALRDVHCTGLVNDTQVLYSIEWHTSLRMSCVSVYSSFSLMQPFYATTHPMELHNSEKSCGMNDLECSEMLADTDLSTDRPQLAFTQLVTLCTPQVRTYICGNCNYCTIVLQKDDLILALSKLKMH